ncbi:MAG: porin [Pseudomonadota bacterium]
MKKALLGTSAVALATAYASTASAAEFEVRVGGYMEQFVAYADSDVDNISGTDFDGVDSKQDAEIHFKPIITLDNGIEIGADVQLEANTAGDVIDESFLRIKGSFGEVLLGSENSAGYKMTFAAPDVTFLNVNSGSTTAFIPFSGTNVGTIAGSPAAVAVGANLFRATLGTTFLENGANNDAQRITYFTPRFAGVQLGVSYARDGLQDSNAQVNIENVALSNIVDFGANYVNSFGDIDVALSGRYGVAFGDGGSDPTIFAAGANVGFAGFTIGGSWAEQNNSGGGASSGSADVLDGTAWDVGISYETGPWGFSFTYFEGENVNNESATALTGNDEELQQFLVGAKYKLAKGVDLNAFGAYVDFEEETGDAGGAGDDVDGFIIGTGIKISF